MLNQGKGGKDEGKVEGSEDPSGLLGSIAQEKGDADDAGILSAIGEQSDQKPEAGGEIVAPNTDEENEQSSSSSNSGEKAGESE
jgi:hypothetical protein